MLGVGKTRAEAARHFQVSNAAVTQHLDRVETRTRVNQVDELFIVHCARCNAEFQRLRSSISRSRYSYCDQACYFAHRANPNYIPWRHGQRIARRVLRDAGIDLPYLCVIHHHDGNNRNNALINLAVFASQSDHLKYHHTGQPPPLWDGRTLMNELIFTTNVVYGGTSFRSYYDSPWTFEETVARLLTLSGQPAKSLDEYKTSVEFRGTFKGQVFTLYDYKEDRAFHVGGTEALDVVGLAIVLTGYLKDSPPSPYAAREYYNDKTGHGWPPPDTSVIDAEPRRLSPAELKLVAEILARRLVMNAILRLNNGRAVDLPLGDITPATEDVALIVETLKELI
jgi:hypothetical protein